MIKDIDLSQYDVTVVGGIWLNSRIIGVGVYKKPVPNDLIEFAKTQIEERNPKAYFSLNGDKVNPYLTIDDLDIPDDVSEDENKNSDMVVDIESMFKSADDFGSISDKFQVEYINSIKDTPAELIESGHAEDYDKVLYSMLNEYKKVAKRRSSVEIESVLSLYE